MRDDVRTLAVKDRQAEIPHERLLNRPRSMRRAGLQPEAAETPLDRTSSCLGDARLVPLARLKILRQVVYR